MLEFYDIKTEKKVEELIDGIPEIPEEAENLIIEILEGFKSKDIIVLDEVIDAFKDNSVDEIEALVGLFYKYFQQKDSIWKVVSDEASTILCKDSFTIISSVSEYINFITKELDDNNPDSSLVFRGEESVEWPLMPSIFRDNKIYSENDYFDQIRLREPAEFMNGSLLDNLVKMQHYGLPTRLLDVTMNPLVALYFACNQSTIPGIIYTFNEYMSNAYESDEVKILTHSVLVEKSWNTVADYISKLREKCPLTEKMEEHHISSIIQKNYFIKANNHNERIKRQQGAFILFGMDFAKIGIPYKAVDESVVSRIIVPGSAKESILTQLDLIGVNEGFLFPELEYQTKYIKSNFTTERKFVNAIEQDNRSDRENDDDETYDELQNKYKEHFLLTIKSMVDDLDIHDYYDSIAQQVNDILDATDWYKREVLRNRLYATFRRAMKHYSLSQDTIKVIFQTISVFYERIDADERVRYAV